MGRMSGGQDSCGVLDTNAYAQKLITDLIYIRHLTLWDRNSHSKEPTLYVMVEAPL